MLASRLPLALGLSLGLSVSIFACGGDEDAEVCFDKQIKTEESTGICGLDNQDLADLVGGRYLVVGSGCFPLGECPSECSAEGMAEARAAAEAKDPDANFKDEVPVCVETDTAAAQCCFWAVFAE